MSQHTLSMARPGRDHNAQEKKRLSAFDSAPPNKVSFGGHDGAPKRDVSATCGAAVAHPSALSTLVDLVASFGFVIL